MACPLRIKVCGVTSAQDAGQAAALGADAIGLNFFPASPRFVEPARIQPILDCLPPFIEPVGVFVNLPLAQACAAIQPFGFRTIQWHGDYHEPAVLRPFRLVPAFRIRDRDTLAGITSYLDKSRAMGAMPAAVLVDAHVSGQYGGTGKTAPWDLLADFQCPVPLILAGGLTPDNVTDAVRRVRPYAVDVASGVESSPGMKDAEKMKRFIENARAAAAS